MPSKGGCQDSIKVAVADLEARYIEYKTMQGKLINTTTSLALCDSLQRSQETQIGLLKSRIDNADDQNKLLTKRLRRSKWKMGALSVGSAAIFFGIGSIW